MFQFPRCPPPAYVFSQGDRPSPPAGLPHSEIPGSPPASALPEAFRSVAASFIGRRRQGIHRAPIIATLLVAPRTRLRPPRAPCPPVTRSCMPRQVTALRRPSALGRSRRARMVQPRPRSHRSADRQRASVVRRPGFRSPCRLSKCGAIVQHTTAVARWWSRGDSNPGPPPCKGGALPAKLRPHCVFTRTPVPGIAAALVGAPGLEPGTSALSGPRSNQLSYAPSPCARRTGPSPARWSARSRSRAERPARMRHMAARSDSLVALPVVRACRLSHPLATATLDARSHGPVQLDR